MFNEIFAEDGKYKTIHRSKGKEYDRVLVNITPAKDEKDITSPLKALTNPTIFDPTISNVETEYNRLIYVGCSRAINELYVCIDGNEESEQKLNKSLADYKKENNIKDDFYDITII